MSNVVLIRKHRRKKSLMSWFRRKVFTSVETQNCFGCDMQKHHPGRTRANCRCPCANRTSPRKRRR